MPKLKVFRTPIGFHDAYVAAPSQKAALKAWGSDKDLFARGIAEIVTDPELTREPLAQPGTVFKRSRGTASEQVAALGKSPRTKGPAKPATPVRRAGPRPDRGPLDAAEAALADATKRQGREVQKIDAEIATLEKRRKALAKRHEAENAKLEKQRVAREASYRRAMGERRE